MDLESVILHLFSGPDASWWKKKLETSSRSVLCLDKMIDPAQDLLSDQLVSFLAELCEEGTVDVILFVGLSPNYGFAGEVHHL